MQQANYPCWLSLTQLKEAQALIDIGFHYCGNSENFCIGYPVGSLGSWKFYSCEGEIALDAVCEGALYSRSLESSTDYEDNAFFEKQLKQAKNAIKKVQRILKEQQGVQLSLFESLTHKRN